MLSWPGRLGELDECERQGTGVGRACRIHLGPDRARLRRVVPEAVRARHRPARTVDDEGSDHRHDVGAVPAEPLGDGMRLRSSLGLRTRRHRPSSIWAIESSTVSCTPVPPSANQYALESPMFAWRSRFPSIVTATKVHDAGDSDAGSVLATTAVLAAAAAEVSTLVAAASALGRAHALRHCWSQHLPRGPGAGQGRHVRVLRRGHPSHTTSTARRGAASSAHRAIASPLRVCTIPRSHTPPTQAVGASRKWSRSLAALRPQDSQVAVGAHRAATLGARAGLRRRHLHGCADRCRRADRAVLVSCSDRHRQRRRRLS